MLVVYVIYIYIHIVFFCQLCLLFLCQTQLISKDIAAVPNCISIRDHFFLLQLKVICSLCRVAVLFFQQGSLSFNAHCAAGWPGNHWWSCAVRRCDIDRQTFCYSFTLYFKSLCCPDVNIPYSQKMVDKDENKQVFCSGCLGDFLSNATSCPSCRALSDLLRLESWTHGIIACSWKAVCHC